jgi:ABC-type transport system involved in multi-copper enzyme maturation permease subunit
MLIVTAVSVVVLYRYVPLLEVDSTVTNVLVYNEGDSSLVHGLESNPGLKVYTYSSLPEVEYRLTRGTVPELGLVIPSNFDQELRTGEQPVLEGYVIHWMRNKDVLEVKQFVEDQMRGDIGRDITIDINLVYTQSNSRGYVSLAAIGMVFVIAMTGMSLTPNLMLEEKDARTMDVLLVSPANHIQVTIAKALAGLFYSLVASLVAFAVNHTLVTHWWLAALTMVIGSVFLVGLGLLLGSVVKVKQQLMLFSWFLYIPLLLPMFLDIMNDLFPETMGAVMYWIPTVALARVFRVSFTENVVTSQFLPELTLVCILAGIILGIVAWMVRNSDR